MGELEGTLRSGAPGPFLHTFNHFNTMVFRFTLVREGLVVRFNATRGRHLLYLWDETGLAQGLPRGDFPTP